MVRNLQEAGVADATLAMPGPGPLIMALSEYEPRRYNVRLFMYTFPPPFGLSSEIPASWFDDAQAFLQRGLGAGRASTGGGERG